MNSKPIFVASGNKPVICTYQGAFSPPTRGHQDAGRILARQLLRLYPNTDITLFYMPTANVASKDSLSLVKAAAVAADAASPSDYVSEAERLELLAHICEELNAEPEFTRVHFEPSDIEFQNRAKGTSTIHTLRTLKERHPSHRLVLAMGEDNGNQLAWWANIEEYPGLIDRMLFVDRVLTPSETAAAAASMTVSTLPFASTYPGATQTHMRFSSGWPITLNGVKGPYTFTEIMASPDPRIRDALTKLAANTDLLEAPLATERAISSSGLRAALRSGDEEEARRIAGVLYPIIKAKGLLTQTKAEVAGMIAAVPPSQRRNTRRRNTRRRNTRRRRSNRQRH